MRDILITAIVFGSLPFIFRSPQFGVMMWVWLSVMNPHRLAFGFAVSYPFVAIVACVTLLSTAIHHKDIRRPPGNAMIVLLFMFIAWTGVTTVYALHQDDAFDMWKTLMKTQILVLLIPMLFHNKEHLRQLIWVIVLSVAFYGTKGGVWILLTGGGERVYGPMGSYIEDNNALAVAVIMMIPLLRYLQLTSPRLAVRRGLVVMMILCGVAVIGSYSRGGLLAVSAMLAFLWLKGRHKLNFLLVAALVIPLLLAYMPDKWFIRMDTLTAEKTQDSTVNPRLNSWATMFNLAKDRPLVGGGFVLDRPDVYDRYSPEVGIKPQVAHSIYFQALGEHGFVGLGLYLLLFLATWRTASWIIRAARDRPDLAWARDLSAMMQVTLVGFAVGGAFLSLVNFDVPYYLIAVMVVTRALVERELRAEGSAPAQVSPGGGTELVTPLKLSLCSIVSPEVFCFLPSQHTSWFPHRISACHLDVG